ncbi:MAG: c-type cytochrome [Blastocatellia bacterium]|nr:c-type cytochrome [Blastocatellia bacterium]
MSEKMHPNSSSKSMFFRLAVTVVFAMGVAALGIACKSDSVVSNSGGQSPAAPADPNSATALATPAPGVTLPPSAVPTTPVGPIGQATPTTQGTPTETQEIRGNMPVTISAAKPALTPAPDPFPARPTPTVVVTGGKVVQQWQAPADAANLANPVKDRPDAARIGRELYMQKCVDCHGKEGKGNGWMGAALKRDGKPLLPTNLASKMVQANTDGELFWKTTNGRSPMPAHRIRFEDEQRWYIVAFLRTLKE